MNAIAAIPIRRMAWRKLQGAATGERMTAEETPVAIVHEGSTTAVMMATPTDLEDFGLGFSLCEGVVDRLSEVRDLEVVHNDLGIEVRLWLAKDCSERLSARRRRMSGPTGCGLCGIDSLDEAVLSPKPITDKTLTSTADNLLEAMLALNDAQPLGQATRAVHGRSLARRRHQYGERGCWPSQRP